MGLCPFFFGANKNMLNKRADKLELLRIAEAVALEKAIDKELIINSMERQADEIFFNAYFYKKMAFYKN